MTSIAEQIQSLLEPPVASTSNDRALQYLDSTYPTFDAINEGDGLDTDASQIADRSRDLNEKLEGSSAALSQRISGTLASVNASLKSAKELSLTRHALADQLATLTEELHPTGKGKQKTILEDLEDLHVRLSELQSARTYVAIVEKAVGLSEESVLQVRSTPSGSISGDSLSKYKELQLFIASVLAALRPAASTAGASLRLDTYLRELQENTWKEVTTVRSEQLLNAVESLKWPTPIAIDAYRDASSEVRTAFESCFVDLLRLQKEGETINERQYSVNTPLDKVKSALRKEGLYPLQALIEPISMRFRYHFDGKRQTNKIDKPEWYFTHVLNLMHEHRDFMLTVVRPLLQKGGYGDINAHDEFCRILFSLPYRKLKRTIPLLLPTPSVLAHTVYQTLIFDGSVRDGGFEVRRTWEGRQRLRLSDELGPKPGPTPARLKPHRRDSTAVKLASMEWDGLSEVILGRKEWFDAWLEGEKRFADNQYNDIISSPDAWQISDDAGDDEEDQRVSVDLGSRVTTSARRFKALMERITERYQPLPHLLHKSHFLFDLQLPLLEAYLSRVTNSLDAYERLSSSFVRAVPGALAGQVGHGADTKRMTSGVEGLTRIVKALISSKWIQNALETWGEDLFFLELWQGIQENAVLRARADGNSSLPHSTSLSDETDNTLFDSLIKRYSVIVARAEDMIVKQTTAEVESELKAYFQSQWEKNEDAEVANDLSIPANLVAPISLLSSELTFLAQSLPTTTVTALYRTIATTLSNHIIQRAVAHRGRNQFSPAEGQTFRDECGMWVEGCRMAFARATRDPALIKRVELPWQGLVDVASVVGLLEDKFAEVAKITFDGSEEAFEKSMTEIGVRGMGRDEVKNLLRARSDFSR